jgi:hypothetical protein
MKPLDATYRTDFADTLQSVRSREARFLSGERTSSTTIAATRADQPLERAFIVKVTRLLTF